MDFSKLFIDLTQYTIPFGYESDIENFLPVGWKKDSVGNYYYEIGQSETLFTSHLDTASSKKEKINHIVQGDIIKTDGTTILGGDNKAGCVILFYLIENKIPGTYYFFLGEESSVHKNFPHGSLLAIEANPNFFKKFKRAISFDRKETGQLITRQLGYNCCSDDFASALISEFSKYGIKYEKDNTGYYTDSAFFGNLISEITNLSSGVWNEHTTNEYVDISYIKSVAIAASKVNWELLPTKREIDKFEPDMRSDTKQGMLSKDHKIFREVFTMLDELYFVCREIRNYKSYLSHFKSGRKYHFTKWHEDDELTLSIQNGKINSNGIEYRNIEDFKRHLGIEKMNRQKFFNLMIDEFDKNNDKLSNARFHYLFYQKGGDRKKFERDLRKSGWLLTKIGKGYQLIRESNSMKYISSFEKLESGLELNHIKKFNELDVNESIGEKKSIIKKMVAFFLLPVSLPIFMNSSTEFKIKTIKKSILNNFIEEKAEYRILDEIKYDVTQPSKLKKIRDRIKLIKRNDKYPTIESYINMWKKIFKKFNILNFKNKLDTDYIFEEIAEYYSQYTDDEWVETSLEYLIYDVSTGKVRKKTYTEIWNQTPPGTWTQSISRINRMGGLEDR